MKKLLLSVAFLSLTAGAMAADLPSRRAPAPIVAAVPVFTWTGFYVGVNAGYGWNTNDDITINGIRYRNDDGGFTGGGQVGFNYQIGAFVVGIESDLQYADLGRRSIVLGPTNPVALTLAARQSSNDWFGTVRARTGVAFDRALVYATGGLAFTDGDTGWTVGGGIEYAFTNNLSAKVEGLHVNLDRNDAFGGSNAEFGVVRAGLNFRFGTY